MSDDSLQLFATHGLRCTRQREAIYDALAANRTHPTADALYQQVTVAGGSACGISLATVYNTLEAFCEAGLAQKLAGAGENGSARYDAARDHHLHMRCQRTGEVADVPEDLSQRILDHLPANIVDELESRTGFKVSEIQIELQGEFDDPVPDGRGDA